MGVVPFDYAGWAARYPEFDTTVTMTQAGDCFSDAGLFLDNTDGSVVSDLVIREKLLWQITSHIAQLDFGSSLGANNPLVGRMDSAGEGSVNFTNKYPDQDGQAAWFSQTKYGATYWAATARYRLFRYRPGPRRRFWPAY